MFKTKNPILPIIIRTIIAKLFRLLFSISFLKKHFFAVYKHIIKPLNLFNGVTQTCTINSIKFNLHLDDWIQQNLYFLGEYEKVELEFLKKSIHKNSTFIDIGANIGIYSLTASKIIDDYGKIISFEPYSKNYNSLVSNIELNKFKNIITERLAIANKNEQINLYYDEKEKNLGMVSMNERENSLKEIVQSTTLDTYVIKNNIHKIDFIKIDIEGNELNALQGMKNILANQKPILLLEILTKKDLNIIISFLNKYKYKKYYLSEYSEIVSKNENPKRLNYIFKK